MTLIRTRPFSQSLASDVETQVDRFFDSFLRQPAGAEPEREWAPTADMYETGDEVVISAELPGLSEKDIHLSITGDLLTIRGQRQWADDAQSASHYRRERWFGKFERTFSLPLAVEVGQVKATYRDGVLTVKLPKAEEIKPKEIKIEAA